ncbi:MAG TPA: ROK family protein [Cellvibrionaceae bacterium]|nr:ROK family protein [Cellvibrionaceae bacterium]
MASSLLFAGIEAGGTKMNCVVGWAGGDIVHQQQFPTDKPSVVLPRMLSYFLAQSHKYGPIAALGVGSFGPLQLDTAAADYGCILATPKLGWSGFNWLSHWREALRVPVVLQTDVNAALLAEKTLGEVRGLRHAVYVTLGTGIGGGIMLDGRLVQGASHPEIGHMAVKRRADDTFAGVCPFHGDCLEGLASGPALSKRWMMPAQQLPADHPAWDLQAFYLAQMCVNITLNYGPQRIVLGGGVAAQGQMMAMLRKEFVRQINGYCRPDIITGVDSYIQRSSLGGNAGQIGSLLLAEAICQGADGF